MFEENLNINDFSSPSGFVEATALGKVDELYQRRKKEKKEKMPDIIIGADTMVTFDGKMYGKPKNHEDAIQMLKKYVIYC